MSLTMSIENLSIYLKGIFNLETLPVKKNLNGFIFRRVVSFFFFICKNAVVICYSYNNNFVSFSFFEFKGLPYSVERYTF